MLRCNMMWVISLCWRWIVSWLLHRWNLKCHATKHTHYLFGLCVIKSNQCLVSVSIRSCTLYIYVQYHRCLSIVLISFSPSINFFILDEFHHKIWTTRQLNHLTCAWITDLILDIQFGMIYVFNCGHWGQLPDKSVVVEQHVDDVVVLWASASDSSCDSWLIVDLGKL